MVHRFAQLPGMIEGITILGLMIRRIPEKHSGADENGDQEQQFPHFCLTS